MWWEELVDGQQSSIDSHELSRKTVEFASREGADADTVARLESFVQDPVTRAILELPEAELEALLVNDAYKPRMHKLYARYMPAVEADFELWVRRSPVSLDDVRREDPSLWERWLGACARRLGVPPYPPTVVDTLGACFDSFQCTQEMLGRAERHGVALVRWEEVGGRLTAFSHGPIEASSHVETTLTQLVQELVVAAQVRQLEQEYSVRITPTHLLASSLAKLALGVARLAGEAQQQAAAAPTDAQQPSMALFAGRRSTSRRFLLLQNWYCMHHLPGYQGTSAVLAVTMLRQLLAQQAQQVVHGELLGSAAPPPPQPAPNLRLVGTLAHEVMMVTDQLLGSFDNLGSSACGARTGVSAGSGSGNGGDSGGGVSTAGSDSDTGPVQVCSLLAHLLLLAAGGGLSQATALCDTFGTRGFVSAALAARLPAEFISDVSQQYPEQWAALPAAARAPDARVFDLFAWWRMDSGEYREMAAYVMDAWEARWGGAPPAARPPRPRLMHSNLDGVDDIIQAWRLPPRIRPAAFAFGTLADGFLPFDCSSSDLTSSATAPVNSSPQDQAVRPACMAGMEPGQTRGPGVQQVAQQAQQAQHDRACAVGPIDGGACGGRGGSSASQAADGTVGIQLCSVVMKAVQSRHAGGALACSTESAGKLGDGAAAGKMQFDRRLPPEAVERTRRRLLQLSRERKDLDPDAVSAALAAAYHAVTREGVLC